MKNKIFPLLLLFPVVAGFCGAFLRGQQIKDAQIYANGFISGSTSFANGLFILCVLIFAIAIGAALLFSRWIKLSKQDMPKINISIPLNISATIILIYAGCVFKNFIDSFTTIYLILALFSVYCSISLFALAKYKMEERENTAYCIMAAVPVFWACFMLILTFREKISDPIIWDYAFHIFAYLSVLFSTYSIAAHTLGKDRKGISVFTCFCGIFFFLIELISPFICDGNITIDIAKITELLPSLAFLILIPFVTIESFRKSN